MSKIDLDRIREWQTDLLDGCPEKRLLNIVIGAAKRETADLGQEEEEFSAFIYPH